MGIQLSLLLKTSLAAAEQRVEQFLHEDHLDHIKGAAIAVEKSIELVLDSVLKLADVTVLHAQLKAFNVWSHEIAK